MWSFGTKTSLDIMMSRASYDYGPPVWPFFLLLSLLGLLGMIFSVAYPRHVSYEEGRKLECVKVQEWLTCPVSFKEDDDMLHYENVWFRLDQLGMVQSIKDGFFDTKIITVVSGKNRFPIQVGKGNLEKTLDLFKDKGNK